MFISASKPGVVFLFLASLFSSKVFSQTDGVGLRHVIRYGFILESGVSSKFNFDRDELFKYENPLDTIRYNFQADKDKSTSYSVTPGFFGEFYNGRSGLRLGLGLNLTHHRLVYTDHITSVLKEGQLKKDEYVQADFRSQTINLALPVDIFIDVFKSEKLICRAGTGLTGMFLLSEQTTGHRHITGTSNESGESTAIDKMELDNSINSARGYGSWKLLLEFAIPVKHSGIRFGVVRNFDLRPEFLNPPVKYQYWTARLAYTL